jgi:hypothetical protein
MWLASLPCSRRNTAVRRHSNASKQGYCSRSAMARLSSFFFQNPKFGFYFLQLITRRLLQNIARLETELSQCREMLLTSVTKMNSPTEDGQTGFLIERALDEAQSRQFRLTG